MFGIVAGIQQRKAIEQSKAYDDWNRCLQIMEPNTLGFSRIIDWDREAMTAIEGVNSEPVGGIDRKPSIMWGDFGSEK